MKRKILSCVLAFCFLIPCAIALTACGAHEHNFSPKWESNATHHWHVCTGEDCKEKQSEDEHEWGEGVITTAPTATSDGVKTYSCTVCGYEKTETVTFLELKQVTSTQWGNALSFSGINSYTLTTKIPGNSNFKSVIKCDGTKVYTNQIGYPDDATSTKVSEEFYSKVTSGSDVKYYHYSKLYGSWICNEISSAFYEQIIPSTIFSLFQYNQFAFNAQKGTYDSIAPIESIGIDSASFEFVEGRLTKVVMVMDVTTEMEFSYEPVSLTVPHVPEKQIEEEMWGKALNFVGVESYTMLTTSPLNSKFLAVHKVDETKMYFRQDGYPNVDNGFVAERYYATTGSGDNTKYYLYTKTDGVWTLDECEKSEYDGNRPNAMFAELQLKDFTFDTTTLKYEASSLTIGGEEIQHVSLSFEDNRLARATFVQGGIQMDFELLYDDVTITLPTIG